MSGNILTRRYSFFENHTQLSQGQLGLDATLNHLSREAGDPTSLAAMTVGSFAFRFARLGFLQGAASSGLSRILPKVFVNGAASIFGLGVEVSAFRGAHNTLGSFAGRHPEQAVFDADGWRGSFVDFTALKIISPLGGYNPILGHFAQANAMVIGHELSADFGLMQHESGSYFDRLAHAEATNIAMGAGMAAFGALSGGRFHAVEKVMDVKMEAITQALGHTDRMEENERNLRERAALGLVMRSGPGIEVTRNLFAGKRFEDPQEFLGALLMDRFSLLSHEETALERRRRDLQAVFNQFREVPLALEGTFDETSITPILEAVREGLRVLLSEGNLQTAEEHYNRAVEHLAADIVLNKADATKWPDLNPEQRASRILGNYYDSHPHRFLLERSFREFNFVRRLLLAQSATRDGHYPKAEQHLMKAQWELRRMTAILLGTDLDTLRSDAEVEGEKMEYLERDTIFGLMMDHLFPERPPYQRLAASLDSFLRVYSFSEDFLRPLQTVNTLHETSSGFQSEEALIAAIQRKNYNHTLYLAEGVRLDMNRILRSILHLPHPEVRGYFRMPHTDLLANLKIVDHENRVWIEFDQRGRLLRAPSMQEMQTGVSDADPDILDVAVIGGGPGGIAAGVDLSTLWVYRYAIFERSEALSTIRELWSREKEADTHYDGPPEGPEGVIGMEDTTRAIFLSRMRSFIEYFYLNIQDKTPVTEISQDASALWLLQTPSGAYRARHIIMTAGRYGKPKLLGWEKAGLVDEVRKRIVRGVDIDALENATVLIIGGGNSAFDYVRSLTGRGKGSKRNRVYVSYHGPNFKVPASLHAHNNDQLLEWEREKGLDILWTSNVASVEPIEELLPEGGSRTRLKVTFKEVNHAPLVVDYISPAVGWMLDRELMTEAGVHFQVVHKKENPDRDPETGQVFMMAGEDRRVPLEGLYVAGDYADQRAVPVAFNTNRRAAVDIWRKMNEKHIP